MIKRRFYRFEHGDKDVPSESSSSDSESEAEAVNETEKEIDVEENVDEEEENEEQEEEDDEDGYVRNYEEVSSSSGYESEDSSLNEVNPNFPGLLTNDDDKLSKNGKLNVPGKSSRGNSGSSLGKTKNEIKEAFDFDASDYVLKCKSVFKCRICPRVVCLSEETLKLHLNSKRHTRSEKLLREGRLKLMLNEKGQIEGETEPEKPYKIPMSLQLSAEKKGIEACNKKKRTRQHSVEKKPNEAFDPKKRTRQPFIKPRKEGNETCNEKKTRQPFSAKTRKKGNTGI